MTEVSGLTVNVAFNVVELADPIERLAGNLRLGRGPKIVEVAPQVRPTGRFTQRGYTVSSRRVKLGIALVTVGLQNSAGICQMVENVLFLPVWCKPSDSTGR